MPDEREPEAKPTGTVIQRETSSPNPRGERAKTETISLDAGKALSFDKDTVLYMIYLMYKMNWWTRNHLKHAFQIINGKHPEDIAKWLVEEAARA